jgi:hypothetical protein
MLKFLTRWLHRGWRMVTEAHTVSWIYAEVFGFPISLGSGTAYIATLLGERSPWVLGLIFVPITVLCALLILLIVGHRAEQREAHQVGLASAPKASLPAEISEGIPDLRVADEPTALALFDPPESDKLIPLLQDGAIRSWARPMSASEPPLDVLAGSIWKTHELVFFPKGQDRRSINQTYLRVRRKVESTNYDIYLNASQLRQRWPHIPRTISLREAAIRAYEATRDKPAGEHSKILAKSNNDILTWYCCAMAMIREGRPPLVSLRGNRPPSRIAEPIPMEDLRSAWDFVGDDASIVLVERYGNGRFENIVVNERELRTAINEIANWGGIHAGNL